MKAEIKMRSQWIMTCCFFVACHISGLICEESDSRVSTEAPLASSSPHASMEIIHQLDHPDKSGYQTQQLGSDKHKYGYELKSSGKHFHHTSTEQDGVRLGCFGYELEGKMYVTQYVADARGYRLVTNQDLISVYPKSGTKAAEGKAGFFPSFNDEDQPRNVRYFFPKGCKGIDVQIDNSSRLRSLKLDNSARLPVTPKPNAPFADSYYTRPPQNYPGPSNIYAPSLIPIQTARPPNSYFPQPPPNNTYLPPVPDNTYLPPKLNNTYLPPPPPNTYLPPDNSIDNTYHPPEETTKKPSYGKPPSTTKKPSYGSSPSYNQVIAIDPPKEPTDNSNYYQPPPSTTKKPSYGKPPPTTTKNPSYGSSSSSSYNQVVEIVPSIELQPQPNPNCPGTVQYCDSTNGCLIIPIELKNRNSENCCSSANYAKLILPLKNFDADTAKKIKDTVPKDIDANDLIRNILDNLL